MNVDKSVTSGDEIGGGLRALFKSTGCRHLAEITGTTCEERCVRIRRISISNSSVSGSGNESPQAAPWEQVLSIAPLF